MHTCTYSLSCGEYLTTLFSTVSVHSFNKFIYSLAVLYPVTLNATSISFDTVQLSWSPPSAINVDYFYVLFAISALFPNSSSVNTSLFSVLCLSGSQLSATVDDLEQGQTYSFAIQYSVRGYNSKSSLSNFVEVKTSSSKCPLCI